PRRVDGELVVAEPRLLRAGGDDEVVVLVVVVDPQRVRGHPPLVQVDVGDRAEDHPRVALPGQDLARGRGDLARREDPGGHLVEQRLEQVVAGPGEHGDVDVVLAQGAGSEQAPEAGPDDEHPRSGVLSDGHVGLLGRVNTRTQARMPPGCQSACRRTPLTAGRESTPPPVPDLTPGMPKARQVVPGGPSSRGSGGSRESCLQVTPSAKKSLVRLTRTPTDTPHFPSAGCWSGSPSQPA